MREDINDLTGEVLAHRLICSALLEHVSKTGSSAELSRLAEHLEGFRLIAGEYVVRQIRVRSRKAVQSFEACLEDAIAQLS